MQYYHKDRPDVIPSTTLCSLAGLASTIPADERAIDDDDSSRARTPTSSPGAMSEVGSRPGHRLTAVGMLSSMSQRHEERKEATRRQLLLEEERNLMLSKALGQDKTTSSARFPGINEQFAIAVAYLGQLSTHDDFEDDEDAMYIVRCIGDVVHGSDQGPAQRMAASVWALAERGLPAARAVERLRLLLPPGTARGGSGSGSGAGVGGFIGRT
jgi:hypothetical protein